MRHVDRLRMGLALAAMLLCLTSSIWLLQDKQKTVPALQPVMTLASVCRLHLSTDATIRIYGSQSQHATWRIRNRDPLWAALTTGIGQAAVAPGGTGRPLFTLVFFSQGGSVDKVIHYTNTRLLYDPETKMYFHALPIVDHVLAQFQDFEGRQESAEQHKMSR